MKVVRMQLPADAVSPNTPKQPLTETIMVPRKGNQNLWHKLSDEEFLKFTRDYIEREGIRTSKQLERANCALYAKLGRRGLRNRIIFNSGKVEWSAIPDRGLLEMAQRLIQEKGMQRRSELKNEDSGLYDALYQRGLMDELHFEKRNNWISMGEEQLLAMARWIIEHNNITSRAQLMFRFHGIYNVLHEKNLLDAAGLRSQKVEWGRMRDEELLAHARLIIDENKLTKRNDFCKKFPGLSRMLAKKGLLDQLPLEYHRSKPRYWDAMGEEKLVAVAKKFVSEEGVSRREDLRNRDSGLHEALRKRGLLDAVFSESEAESRSAAVQGVLDELKKFGGSE